MNEAELAEHIANHSIAYRCAECGKDEWNVEPRSGGERVLWHVKCRNCGHEEEL